MVTIEDLLVQNSLEKYSIMRNLSTKQAPYCIQYSNNNLLENLYLFMTHLDDQYKPNMIKVGKANIEEYYEFYVNPTYFREKDFIAFNLTLSDYDLSGYILKKDIDTKEIKAICILEKNTNWILKIEKNGTKQYYREISKEENIENVNKILDIYKVNSVLGHFDSDKKLIDDFIITIDISNEYYNSIKEQLNLNFTF